MVQPPGKYRLVWLPNWVNIAVCVRTMIKIDITAQWGSLRIDPDGLSKIVLDTYGADRFAMGPFPYAVAVDTDGSEIGLVDTYNFPRVTVEGDSVFLELSDLYLSDRDRDDIRERLAALCHQQWSSWIAYMLEKGCFRDDGTWVIPAEHIERWQKQGCTCYQDLIPEVRAADRAKADSILELFDEEP